MSDTTTKRTTPRLSLLLLSLAMLGFVALDGPTRVLSKWAYAVESGRIQASNEQLAELNENLASIEKVSQAFRLVAQVAAPSVVHLRVRGAAGTEDELAAMREREAELRAEQRTLERELRRTEDANIIPDLERVTDALRNLRRQIRRLEFSGPRGTGSGVIFDERGYIVTNNHVVEGQRDIFVTLSDDREYRGRLVGTDRATDLAVVKIDAEDLRALDFGDSDAMRVGDWVLAIGAPFGLSQTVTHGIISATNRSDINVRPGFSYQDFLQTDAAINPGNSGGPLVNLRAQVVGINTAIASDSDSNDGVAFTIPANTVMKVATQLRDTGEVARGWLGVTLSDLLQEDVERLELRSRRGVMVDAVYEGSPADRGGLLVEDVILRVNGRRVREISHLQVLVANVFPGETAHFVVLRDGREQDVKVRVGRRPENVTAAAQTQRPQVTRMLTALPLEVRSLRDGLPGTVNTYLRNQELATDILAHMIDERTGVAVINVDEPRGAALDLKPGELITSINGRQVDSVARMVEALNEARGSVEMRVYTPLGDERTVTYRASGMD